MKKLKLSFLDNPHQVDQPNLLMILEEFGKEIADYGKDYFSYILTSGSVEGVLTDFSLYIIVPEIGYEYRVINVEIIDVATLKIRFFTLVTKQTEHYDIDIKTGTQQFENKLSEILSSNLFNASLKFLVEQVHLKQQYSDDLKGKIRIGEARVAILKTGEKINAGFQRIDGNQVTYYTGKGLREIFKPNMNEIEIKESTRLKNLSEEELIKGGYMAQKNISDFDDIE